MLRRLHSLPGLLAGLLVMFMALTGLVPFAAARDRTVAGGTAASRSASATLGRRGCRQLPGVTRIVKMASGTVIAYAEARPGRAAVHIDPATGAGLGPYEPSPVFAFMTELHRSLFLGQGGHVVRRRCGARHAGPVAFGWIAAGARAWVAGRRCLAPPGARLRQRLHVDIGRFVLVALLLSGLTGAYMSLVSFGPCRPGRMASWPSPPSTAARPRHRFELAALQATPLSQLRELVFPAHGDPTDVFTLTTNAGQGYVDQATGAMLDFVPNSLGQTVYEAIYTLHTGQGIWWLALSSGIAALGVPVMAVSGTVIWWMRRRDLPRLSGNVAAGAADTVILVGSEGNSTWGFAATLHDAPDQAGHRVHTAPMNSPGPPLSQGHAPVHLDRHLWRRRRAAKRQPVPVPAGAVRASAGPGLCGARLRRPQLRQFLPVRRPTSRQRCVAKGWTAFSRSARSTASRRRPLRNGAIEPAARLGTPLHLVHTPTLPDHGLHADRARRLWRRSPGADQRAALRRARAAAQLIWPADWARQPLAALRGRRSGRHRAARQSPYRATIRSPVPAATACSKSACASSGGAVLGVSACAHAGRRIRGLRQVEPRFPSRRGRRPSS